MMAGVHAVVCPYPAFGHVNPLLNLSRLLASKGVRVTFVCTHFYCELLLRKQCQDQAVLHGGELPNICFEGLDDGLPPSLDRSCPSTELARAIAKLGPAFQELMHRLTQSSSCPAPSVIISDAFVPWTHDVAAAMSVPRAFFWPQSVAVFTIFAHTSLLLDRGFDPFQDDLDTAASWLIDFLPGTPALPASKLPYRVKPVDGKDRRFLLYEILEQQLEQCKKDKWVLANSMEDLEGCAVQALESKVGISMKLLGPLLPSLYVDKKLPESIDDDDLLCWLNTRAASSVLYISLGTAAMWTEQQVQEVGLGLIAQEQPFLWVMRPWEMMSALPVGLMKLGKVVRFAPQLLVLAHPAVGGFLSHCGWNSVQESLSVGVPILAWPQFLDQFTNCWYVVHKWKVGMELPVVRRGGSEDATLDRPEFERAVQLLMKEEAGREMRMRAAKLRDVARNSALFGTSSRNLDEFLSELIFYNTNVARKWGKQEEQ